MKISNLIKKYLLLMKGRLSHLKIMTLYFIISSIFDIVGIGLIGPYISMLINDDHVNSVKSLINLNQYSNQSIIIYMGLLIIFIFIFKSFISIYVNYKIVYFCENIQYSMRLDLMENIFKSDYNLVNNKSSPYYLNLFQNSIPQFSFGITQSITRILCESIIVLTIVIYLFFINPFAMLFLITILSSFALLYDKLFRFRLVRYGEQIYQSSILCFRYFNESLFGYKSIKVLQKDNFFKDLLKNQAGILRTCSIKAAVISNSPKSLIEFILVFLVVLFTISLVYLGLSPIEIFPVLSMFGVAALRILPSMNTLSNCFNQIRLNTNCINSLYDEHSSRQQTTQTTTQFHPPENHEFNILDIRNLSFMYPNTKVGIFENLSLTVKKGDVIGIIGESGSGKSTLIDLILGFQTADSGQFSLNGYQIDPSSELWREKIAYIPQENFLIDGTIRDNITLGMDLDKVNNIQFITSLNLSQLDEVVSNFEHGVDTMVGENGSLLSGGQRQRIALARAIYHNRKFLILDESTSSIDKNTEMMIIKELNKLKGNITLLIISHTPEILTCCTKIFKLVNKNLTQIK
jgi:ABC-type multidrug transport system fused ATPase/permease subunit